jgi:predicted nuclease of predicted toxin-antitoxin system
MKLLLDECAPKRLKNDFPGHEIQTVDDVGLRGLKNGELLRAAAE